MASYAPSQADVQVYKAMGGPPQVGGLNHLRRWYRHTASFESEFAVLPENMYVDLSGCLPGDVASASEAATQSVGQDVTDHAHAEPLGEAKDHDAGDDLDLFGSDEDEVDEEEAKAREGRLREYKERKADKAEAAAKTAVTLDVKPWGECRSTSGQLRAVSTDSMSQMTRRQ